MSLGFRRGDGPGLRNPHGGGIQAVRQGPAGGLEAGERRRSGTSVHAALQPREESFPLILYFLNNVILCFRWIRMGEVSRKISELISDSANKGKPAGVIRREVINWCLGNVSHDDAALQEWLKPQLIARQEMRTVKFNTNHLVQAMRIWDLQPLVVRNSGCACWNDGLKECGLGEFSAKDRALIAGMHHEIAKTDGGFLSGCGVTVQYDQPIGEAVMTANLGSLLKLYKILAAMWGLGVRQRAIFAGIKLRHHKVMLIEGEKEQIDGFRVVNLLMAMWKPYLHSVCGMPENMLPNRVFATIRSEQRGSYFAACTEGSQFKECDTIRNFYMPPDEFPRRAFLDSAFNASREEKLVLSLRDQVEGVEEVLERTRGQMAQNKKVLKRVNAFQARVDPAKILVGNIWIGGGKVEGCSGNKLIEGTLNRRTPGDKYLFKEARGGGGFSRFFPIGMTGGMLCIVGSILRFSGRGQCEMGRQ